MTLASRFFRLKRKSATGKYYETSAAEKIRNSKSSGLNSLITLRIQLESIVNRTYTTPRVIAHSITQCSRKSIHINTFVAKKKRYYSPGLLFHLVQRERTSSLDSFLLYQGASRIPAESRNRISCSHIASACRPKSGSPAQSFLHPNARDQLPALSIFSRSL